MRMRRPVAVATRGHCHDGSQATVEPSVEDGGVISGRRIMRNELNSPIRAGEDGDEQRDLE